MHGKESQSKKDLYAHGLLLASLLVAGLLLFSGCVSSPNTPPGNQVPEPAGGDAVPTPTVDTTIPIVHTEVTPSNAHVGDPVTVRATASDNRGIKSIDLQVRVSGEWKTKTCTSSPCEYVIQSVPSQDLEIIATATDTSDNTAQYPPSGTSTFHAATGIRNNDTIAPRITVTQDPASPHVGQSVSLTAFVSDISGVNSVSVYVDGALAKTCSFEGTKIANCIVSQSFPATGQHAYYATAVDTFSNQGQSDPITMNVLP